MQGTCNHCEEALPGDQDFLDMKRALKVHRVLDVVTGSSIHTNCFTKSYRKNLFGAGSVIASKSFARRFCEASHGGRLLLSEAGKQELAILMSSNQSLCEKVHQHLLSCPQHVNMFVVSGSTSSTYRNQEFHYAGAHTSAMVQSKRSRQAAWVPRLV